MTSLPQRLTLAAVSNNLSTPPYKPQFLCISLTLWLNSRCEVFNAAGAVIPGSGAGIAADGIVGEMLSNGASRAAAPANCSGIMNSDAGS